MSALRRKDSFAGPGRSRRVIVTSDAGSPQETYRIESSPAEYNLSRAQNLWAVALQPIGLTADSSGMIAFLLIFGVNVLLVVATFLRERGEDPRFVEDRLIYRS